MGGWSDRGGGRGGRGSGGWARGGGHNTEEAERGGRGGWGRGQIGEDDLRHKLGQPHEDLR